MAKNPAKMTKKKRAAKKSGAGRPPYVPTDKERSAVETMAGYGIPFEKIARSQKISINTLKKHFSEELEMGRVKADSNVIGALYNSALAGGAAQQIWWTKVRCGWKEPPQRLEHAGKDGAELNLAPIIFYGEGREMKPRDDDAA